MIELDKWKALYGSGLLARECRLFTSCVALTSPSAWRAVEPFLPAEPRGKAFVTNQEQDYLEGLARELPDAEWVLGIGGGKALDAGKFVAWKKGLPLVLVPTIVSTGSVFQSGVPARRNGKIYIIHQGVSPECVLFDTDVIRAAPPHLNAAGMAECICYLGRIASWRWWIEEGLEGPAWDEAAAREAHDWVRDRVKSYVSGLDPDGRPGEQAIRTAAEVNRERQRLRIVSLKAAHGLCHIFDNTFLWTHGRDLFHGEAVALGTLMGCHLYDWGFDEAKTHFQACGTRFRPRDIGCTWNEVRAALARAVEHSDHLKWPSTYLHCRRLDDATFRPMGERIDAE